MKELLNDNQCGEKNITVINTLLLLLLKLNEIMNAKY